MGRAGRADVGLGLVTGRIWGASSTIFGLRPTEPAEFGHSTRVSAVEQWIGPAPDFETLYDAHFSEVRRLLARLGVPSSGVDDATQETFVIAYRQLPGFRGEAPAKAWLYGIALRVAKDVRRQLSRKGGGECLDSVLELQAPEQTDVTAMQRQALRQVFQLLQLLPAEQREVLVLMELEEMTAPEVALVTGTPLNTVYTRLRTARMRFNSLVEALDGEGLR
jgi:RNA polymerase sigma-70 factor, ECF subfamily